MQSQDGPRAPPGIIGESRHADRIRPGNCAGSTWIALVIQQCCHSTANVPFARPSRAWPGVWCDSVSGPSALLPKSRQMLAESGVGSRRNPGSPIDTTPQLFPTSTGFSWSRAARRTSGNTVIPSVGRRLGRIESRVERERDGLGSRRKWSTSARLMSRLRAILGGRSAHANAWARGGLNPATSLWRPARFQGRNGPGTGPCAPPSLGFPRRGETGIDKRPHESGSRRASSAARLD